MAEGKKYFWLKLYSDFFTSKRVKRLRSLAGGDTYTIIYLKMQLKALTNDGYLYFDGVMDNFADELALDIDESPDDVKLTIEYLLRTGLLECTEDGKEWYLTYLKNCIGVETASAQRVRAFRERQKEQKALQCNTPVTEVKRVCSAEKEIEKDIEIEKEKKKEKKNAYGEYAHVKLTATEYQRLVSDYGQEKTEKAIKFFDEYIEDKGYKSKSHNMAMRRWVFNAVDEQEQKRAKAPTNKFNSMMQNSYTHDEMSELERKLLDN